MNALKAPSAASVLQKVCAPEAAAFEPTGQEDLLEARAAPPRHVCKLGYARSDCHLN